MNTKMEQLTDSFKARLVKMETSLDGLKSDIKIGSKEAKSTIQAKLKEAKKNVKSLPNDIKSAEGKAVSWIKAKEKASEAVVQGWKDKFDKAKLEHHAKAAEENADAAISLAEDKMGAAVFAVYEAMEARLNADETPESKH